MNDMLKDELYHKWTDAMKADYNHEYYQKHKDWWKTKYADFTGGVKRAAENAKETVKGETPQSLWKSGARDIRKNLPELKKGISSNAKTLAERAKRKAPEVIDEAKWQADRLARKIGADKAKALWDDGAKDIKSKAYKTARKTAKKVHDAKVDVEWAISNNDAVGNVRRKAKEFVSNWKSGAQGTKSAAKSATSKAGKSFLENWKSGAQGIANAVTKKKRK